STVSRGPVEISPVCLPFHVLSRLPVIDAVRPHVGRGGEPIGHVVEGGNGGIRDHFPEENIADGRPGRKPTPTRCVLEGVLWILNTGAQWNMLPQSYPNYKTVHRRFQTWCRDEVLRRVLTEVANELRDRGALDEEECFIDATFVMAKGGGLESPRPRRGRM